MAVTLNLEALRTRLSARTEILSDPGDSSFTQHAKRWTDVDRKVPGAIVLPTSERDIQETVKWARETSTPFVPKSGGHGLWSTIDHNGIVVDLSRISGIRVDAEREKAVLKGAVLTKEVALTLAKVGKCAALGNSNGVGAIPYFLGGGAPVAAFRTGYGADNILAARMITAEGDVLEVNEASNSDLLWALKGAGFYFGIVTELTIRIHSLSVVGTPNGAVWTYLASFPLDRAEEVCMVVKDVIENDKVPATGVVLAMASPPAKQPALVISAKYFGDPFEAEKVFAAVSSLVPIFEQKAIVPIQNMNDALEAQDAHGDYKDFKIIGLHKFEVAAFLETVRTWKELIEESPDAIETFFSFKWESRPAATPEFDSAMCLRDIRFWQINMLKCTRKDVYPKIEAACEKSFVIQRTAGTQNSKDYVDFVPGNRSGPIEYRFRGVERLSRLRALKKQWDPSGVFTRQLL